MYCISTCKKYIIEKYKTCITNFDGFFNKILFFSFDSELRKKTAIFSGICFSYNLPF